MAAFANVDRLVRVVDSTGQRNTFWVWTTHEQVLVKSVLIASSPVSWSLSLVVVRPWIASKPRRSKAIGFKPLSVRMDGVCVDRLSPQSIAVVGELPFRKARSSFREVMD